tara:strand:- start:7680 stop:8081 length:402 start_codon:yes stop_codon:yes gene_type:complete
MNFSANRLVFIIGAFLLALMAIDGLIQLNREALSSFGFGSSPWVNADSAAAMLLVGLVAGMIIGIGLFFGYLMWREKQIAQSPDEIETLLAEIARDEESQNPLFVEENSMEETMDTLDPWERPADWWKRSNED